MKCILNAFSKCFLNVFQMPFSIFFFDKEVYSHPIHRQNTSDIYLQDHGSLGRRNPVPHSMTRLKKGTCIQQLKRKTHGWYA